MVEASDGRGSEEKVEAKEGKGEVRQERKVDGEAATLVAVEGVAQGKEAPGRRRRSRERRRSWSQRPDSGDEEEAEGNETRARRCSPCDGASREEGIEQGSPWRCVYCVWRRRRERSMGDEGNEQGRLWFTAGHSWALEAGPVEKEVARDLAGGLADGLSLALK